MCMHIWREAKEGGGYPRLMSNPYSYHLIICQTLVQAKRSIAQFWPHSWDRFHWALYKSPKRLLQCLVLVAVFLLVEVNAFFLKYVLWVPPLNPLNTYRLILLFLMGIPAVREYYIFIETDEVSLVMLHRNTERNAAAGIAAACHDLHVDMKILPLINLEVAYYASKPKLKNPTVFVVVLLSGTRIF